MCSSHYHKTHHRIAPLNIANPQPLSVDESEFSKSKKARLTVHQLLGRFVDFPSFFPTAPNPTPAASCIHACVVAINIMFNDTTAIGANPTKKVCE